MNKFFLWLIMLPSGLWRGMGADVPQLRAILSVRLKLDDRRPISFGRNQKPKKERKNGTVLNMFLYLVTGFIYMLPLQLHDRILGLTLYFSLFLLMLTLTLVTDFSNVLFDTRDKFIILPRPVSDNTILVSKLLHVFIYLLRIVLPMSIPGWALLGAMDGWPSAVLFIFPLILLIFMALFFVNGLYLLLLKLAKPGRFKEIINYFQITFSVLFFACCYLLPRVFEGQQVLQLNIRDYPFIRIFPSYWLAACWSWLGFNTFLPGTRALSILAVVFPVGCLYIMVKWLSPQFASKIGAIDDVASTEQQEPVPSAVKVSKARGGRKLYHRLAGILNKSDAAKAGFIITWLQTSRSRTFKMRVYPVFAYVPVYFVYLLTMNRSRPLNDTLHSMTERPAYLILLYMCTLVIMQALSYLTISDQYKAAWVYAASPLHVPGQVMAGAFKAIWIKYCFPFFLILGGFIVAYWGLPTIIDVILAVINITLFATAVMRIGFRHLPFSIMEQMNQGGARIIRVFLSMFIVGLLGLGHYLALHILVVKLIFLVLSSILLWLVWDSYASTNWEAVKMAEE